MMDERRTVAGLEGCGVDGRRGSSDTEGGGDLHGGGLGAMFTADEV